MAFGPPAQNRRKKRKFRFQPPQELRKQDKPTKRKMTPNPILEQISYFSAIFSIFLGRLKPSGPKKHDSQRRDRILHFFLRPIKSGNFLHIPGAISLLTCTVKNLENRKKSTGDGDGTPKLQISVACRVRTRPEIYSEDVRF